MHERKMENETSFSKSTVKLLNFFSIKQNFYYFQRKLVQIIQPQNQPNRTIAQQ